MKVLAHHAKNLSIILSYLVSGAISIVNFSGLF
jgi:hypothetical protein